MFNKILFKELFLELFLPLLLPLGLVVGLVVGLNILTSISAQQAKAFCDAIPLATKLDIAHFKQTLLHTQPTKVFGSSREYGEYGSHRFEISLDHTGMTEQKITASGMEAFLSTEGALATDKQVDIRVVFSLAECDIQLAQQRVNSKRIARWD